jgi:CRP/FNR family transcriptional regulator, cyclic AMP receptor protein
MPEASYLYEDLKSHNTVTFSEESFLKLKGIMYEHFIQKGSRVFLEGDPADKIYYLKSGAVRLKKVTNDGKDLSLYYYREGDLFGEFDQTSNKVCTFSAETTTDCTIGVIQQQDLEILMWQHGDLALDFMKWMGYMQRFTQLKLRDLMFYGKNGALASTLIRMSNTYGIQNGNTIHIVERFTNSEIASIIGATRETVNRMLAQLKKSKIISYDDGTITILDLEALKKICHCEECPAHICRL